MRITQRLDLLKLVVLIGLLFSVLLSINLWAGQRWFPKVPLFNFVTGLKAPFDYFNVVVLIILISLTFFSHKKLHQFLLVMFCLYLCTEDQCRLQPWFYCYVLILFVLLFYKKRVDEPNNYISVFLSLQILVALIYVFSGLQKFNNQFVNDTFVWMLTPIKNNVSQRQFDTIIKFGNLVPYIELFIGFGLLIKPLRYIALPLIVTMHFLILIFIGPFGNSYNFVVWPWNIIMILLNLILFANVEKERFFDVSILFKGACFYIVITLTLIFPMFSFNNKYDSYLSNSLYSGNTHNATLILSDKALKKLPYYLHQFVLKNTNYNILYIKQWAINELKVPCVPEYRIFKNVQKRIIFLTNTNSNEVKLVFTERQKLLNF